MRSENFKEELFTDLRYFEEGPLRDRKREIYNLMHNDCKVEFLKDVIALANSARMLGKPAYLLFGINNDGHPYDITDSLKPYKTEARKKAKGHDWDDPP